MKRAIVLSGGGGKGAYQIGVWKALRKKKIHYDIVTGTSVGALNGALMTQKEYHKAVLLWQKIDFSAIFKEADSQKLMAQKDWFHIFQTYLQNVLNGGMEISNLEKLVQKNVNTKKIKNSKIDFGIVTVNFRTLKPLILTKNEMTEDTIYDYLIASASCFPFFQKKEVKNEFFIDGGFYDNMPINLAIDLGAEEIIAVDLNAVGMVRPVKNKKIPITYIKPRNEIGSFLVFDKKQSHRAIKLGYLDTLKVLGYFDGNQYTFPKNSLSKNQKIKEIKMQKIIEEIFNTKNESLLEEFLNKTSFNRVSKQEKEVNRTLEYLAKHCNLDETKVYRLKTMEKKIRQTIREVPLITKESLDKKRQEFKFVPTPLERIKYFYTYIKEAKTHPKMKKELRKYALVFPKDFLAAIYLTAMEAKK